jgi:putative pyruvate formate lyase activating enzyme
MALPHYFRVLEGKEKPYFSRLRDFKTGFSTFKNFSPEELLVLHQQEMEKFKAGRKDKSLKEKGLSLLDLKAEIAEKALLNCSFCAHRCGKNRQEGETGVCGVSSVSYFSSEFLHLGEEPELVPSHTIFFNGCTMKCVYCQNWDIANAPQSGWVAKPERLAEIIKQREKEGARNVNFVGGEPTPHLATILKTLLLLEVELPVIWNSNQYYSELTANLLEGVVDLYLADFRYGNDECAFKYSKVKDYFSVVSKNFLKAYRQTDVILRHLVLPGHLKCCTEPIMKWTGENLPDVYFNLMFQYYPAYRASLYPEINRRLTFEERTQALELARSYRLMIG